MQNIDKWKGGTEVRLRNDPAVSGVCTGVTRVCGDLLKVQVNIPGHGKTFQADYELEIVESAELDPYVLVEQGRFARASDLRRCLTHVQLSGKLANIVYSMETTNTDFFAYQYKPVLSFLESPSNGLLIADEVGLGKTIEAGLIWTELRARLDARRLMVLCPAVLREKWRDELAKRFGVDARIMGLNEACQMLSKPFYEWPDNSAIIASMQGMRTLANLIDELDNPSDDVQQDLVRFARLLDERSKGGEPLLDMLIVDEAHYMRNPSSLTSKIGMILRGVAEHVVLLSATPINLKSEDLYYLLRMIDPDNFDAPGVFPAILNANEPLINARRAALDMTKGEDDIKRLLRDAVNHELLRNSKQLESLLSADLTKEYLGDAAGRVMLANQLERVNLLSKALTRTRKVEVTEWRVVREPVVLRVPMSGMEGDFYNAVTDSIREYATRQGISSGFLLSTPQRQISSSMAAAASAWSKGDFSDAELIYEDFGQADESEDSNKISEKQTSEMARLIADEVLPDVDLNELRQNDSKYREFRTALREYLRENPGEKVVVFSYFRATVNYLAERLQVDGIEAAILMGGMRETKQQVINNFQESLTLKVLIATEVASEGVDLQFCRVLFNYDLPWNPMRVEQRIGRIDRLGQRAKKINIINFCYAGTIDERILDRLYERLDIFRKSLGDLEAILGSHIMQLTTDLLSQRLTPEQESQRIEKTALAIERIGQEQRELEEQASNLIAHSGYILEQVNAARQFARRITEDDLTVYVRDYLERYAQGYTFKQPDDDPHELLIKLPSAIASEFNGFVHRRRLSCSSELKNGGETRCRVVNKVTRGYLPWEQISQFHPFVRFISEELGKKDEHSYPVFAVTLDSGALQGKYATGVYAFWVCKWVFTGIRTEEDLRARAFVVEESHLLTADRSLELVHAARLFGKDWLSVASEASSHDLYRKALNVCETQVTDDFEAYREMKDNENYDRVNFQKNTVLRFKERKIIDIQARIEKLRERGHTNLIPAMEGQIRRQEENTILKIEELGRKEKLSSFQREIAAGVIKVE